MSSRLTRSNTPRARPRSHKSNGRLAVLHRPRTQRTADARPITPAPQPTRSSPSANKLVLDSLRELAALKVKVESKAPVPPFRGKDSPIHLSPPHPGYSLVDTKESALLASAMSRMFAGRIYPFRITSALNISASGTGAVNSIIAMATIQSTADFSALSGVFNEFFIKKAIIHYEPVSMYNYPLTGAVGTNVSSLPIGCADLQHAQPTYTSLTTMTENWRFALNNSGRPFDYSWTNSEDPNSKVVPADTPTGATTQAWAMTTDAGAYTGTLQFLSQSAPPALPVSQVLGTFLVEWEVLFRVRL